MERALEDFIQSQWRVLGRRVAALWRVDCKDGDVEKCKILRYALVIEPMGPPVGLRERN